MAFNLTNPGDSNPPSPRGTEGAVVVTVHPHPNAIKQGWRTELERAPDDGNGDPSTADAVTVRVVPAEQQRIVDRSVPSTTGQHFYRARHILKGSPDSDWTEWAGANPRTNAAGVIQQSRDLNSIDVTFETSHQASTAEVTVKVFDPETRVNSIEFRKKDTSTGFPTTSNWSTDWDGSTGVTGSDENLRRTENLPVLTKHNSALDPLIRYRHPSGKNAKFDPGPIVFDQDDVAELTNLSLSFSASGAGIVSAGVDTDGEGNRIFVNVSGSTPVSDPSSGSNSGVINLSSGVRSGRVQTTHVAAIGSNAFAKAVAENGAGKDGPVKGPVEAIRAAGANLKSYQLVSVEDDSTNLTYQISWSPTDGVKDSVHDLVHDLFKSTGTPPFVATVTTTDPQTTTSSTFTVSNTTYADGVFQQRHRAQGNLTDGTNTIDSKSNSVDDIDAPS